MSRRLDCPQQTGDRALDAALAASFPASDPVAALVPAPERRPPGRRECRRGPADTGNAEKRP